MISIPLNTLHPKLWIALGDVLLTNMIKQYQNMSHSHKHIHSNCYKYVVTLVFDQLISPSQIQVSNRDWS